MAHKKQTQGLIPPQDIEAEKALLGSVLDAPQNLSVISDLFKADIFYTEQHIVIARAILKLYERRSHIDSITVNSQLTKDGDGAVSGGAFYLMSLMQYSSPGGIKDHLKRVSEMYMLRQLIVLGSKLVNEAYNQEDPFKLIRDITTGADNLQKGTMTTSEVHISELALAATRERELNPGVKQFLGTPTGLQDLDDAIGGLQGGQLVVIGARPAMGKTAVALAITEHIGNIRKEPIALFTLEMRASDLYVRMQSKVSGVHGKKIKKNNLNETEKGILNDADGELSEANIYIDETPALNIDSFRAKVSMMKHKYGIKVAVIDYLQLMRGSSKHFNQEAEVAEISGKLKQVANELDIAVVALSQLSRALESRPGAMGTIPKMSDLRNSGSIEQDADLVIFLWRPAYYKIDGDIQFPEFNRNISPKNLLVFVIAKQRAGETMNIPAYLDLSTMRLTDHPDVHPQVILNNSPLNEPGSPLVAFA